VAVKQSLRNKIGNGEQKFGSRGSKMKSRRRTYRGMENSTRDNEIRLGRQTKTRTETKFPQEETRTKKNQIGLRGTGREQSGAGKPTTSELSRESRNWSSHHRRTRGELIPASTQKIKAED
jgi:hypothetical protein